MICVLWLHKHGEKPRDVYGADSIAFALLQPGDVFKYADHYRAHDGSYIVRERRVEITGARTTFEIICDECAPASEVAS